MARNRYTKKYRKWKKRAKKSYRKKKYSSKYKKTVMNKAWKVRGIRHKLDNRPEMKFTLANWYTAIAVPQTAWINIWGNNNRWDASNYCIRAPTVGTGQAQYIGTQLNSLYADVRIYGWVDYTIVPPLFALRLSVHRSRTAQNYDTQPEYVMPGNGSMVEPWDTKLWDLYFDKVYTMSYNAGNASSPKLWRFKIPLKQTLTLKDNVLKYEYPIFISATCTHNNGFIIKQIFCKFYYKDP